MNVTHPSLLDWDMSDGHAAEVDVGVYIIGARGGPHESTNVRHSRGHSSARSLSWNMAFKESHFRPVKLS